MLESHEDQHLNLVVRQMRTEAVGVLSLTLEDPDGADLPAWRPGAHIDLKLPGDITRQYSLCGDPEDRTSWRIAVLREPEGRGGSVAVHDLVRPGDSLEVVGPRNNFRLDEAPDYVFIAGGIGITPILAMIKAVSAAGSRWSLLYGGRERRSMAFTADLAAHGDAVRFQPEDEFGLLDIDELLALPRPETLIYCCGPEPLLEAVESRAEHWPKGALRVERFAPKAQPAPDPESERDFELVMAKSGRTICVPAGKAILETIEAEGFTHQHSCREGVCGSCETAVLEGVPDHRDSFLLDDERAANDTMMICVGRAKSDRLVLDL